MSIHEKAMLVTLNRSVWTARKHDQQISDDTAKRNQADSDAGRYIKLLMPKDAMEDVKNASTKAYLHHKANTLPWDDFGSRLLPVGNYFEYVNKQREYKDTFDQAVTAFLAKYDALVKAERKRQGKGFNQNDYPAVVSLKDKFGMRVSMMPLPAEGDLRLDLNKKELDKIKRDVTNTVNERLKEATDALWERLQSHVDHLRERLDKFNNEETKRLHTSLLTNLNDIVDVAARLNFTDDPNIEAMRQAVKEKLLVDDIKALRHSESLRVEKIKAANDILATMSGYMGGQ